MAVQLGPWLRLAVARKRNRETKKKKGGGGEGKPRGGSSVGGAWWREAGLGSESSTGCHPGPRPTLRLFQLGGLFHVGYGNHARTIVSTLICSHIGFYDGGQRVSKSYLII